MKTNPARFDGVKYACWPSVLWRRAYPLYFNPFDVQTEGLFQGLEKTTMEPFSVPTASRSSSGDQFSWVMAELMAIPARGFLSLCGCQTMTRPSCPAEASNGPRC